MTERPIPFSGPMVRATLAGEQTQTRRVVKVPAWTRGESDGAPAWLQKWATVWDNGTWHTWDRNAVGGENDQARTVDAAKEWALRCALRQGFIACPYGVPGDTLWVRETWTPLDTDGYSWASVRYRADDSAKCFFDIGEDAADKQWRLTERLEAIGNGADNWRPSIHMPRWASRLTLEITDVRVQRVQDITVEDARAEGFPLRGEECKALHVPHCAGARNGFVSLWQKLNAKRGYSWQSNPWVWVIAFTRVGAA